MKEYILNIVATGLVVLRRIKMLLFFKKNKKLR